MLHMQCVIVETCRNDRQGHSRSRSFVGRDILFIFRWNCWFLRVIYSPCATWQSITRLSNQIKSNSLKQKDQNGH